MTKEKLVIYSRANNSRKQRKHTRILRSLASTFDLEVVGVYEEETRGRVLHDSGYPALSKMIDKLESGEANTVFTFGCDRLPGHAVTVRLLRLLANSSIYLKVIRQYGRRPPFPDIECIVYSVLASQGSDSSFNGTRLEEIMRDVKTCK